MASVFLLRPHESLIPAAEKCSTESADGDPRQGRVFLSTEFSVSAAPGLVAPHRVAEDRQMTRRKMHGQMTQYEMPHWDPLLKLLAEYLVAEFMWMHEVELKDGTRLHAYKNIETRRYLHLSSDGRAFVYCEDDQYREVEISRALLERVLAMTPRFVGE